ncbi:MAG: type IV secretion system DNA-binding domain-containing protein [Nitrososphaerales archaeon]|nr:type IV secretion system DNA-binding domain-containing protein [Nitrososphaerales archaeon]
MNNDGYYFSPEDFRKHIYVVGGTGTGKTNLLLLMMSLLAGEGGQKALPCSVIFIDPAGDAALMLPRIMKDMSRLTILDPSNVSFAFNPVMLYPHVEEKTEKALQMQNQVGELVSLLQDVLSTDPALTHRLHWIYRGSLYFLYSFGDNATFLDLYNFMMDLMRRDKEEVTSMFRRADVAEEIFVRTMEAIAGLERNAYTPVLNRISNFVMPPASPTARTFCARNTTINFDEPFEPGHVTILRLDKSLPSDFREMITGALVMKIWFLLQARAKRLEREGKDFSARTPVLLVIDEFQNIQKLRMLETMLSEGRKFGLSLVLAHQYLSQITRKELIDGILGNVGTVCAFQCGPDDASALSKVLGEKYARDLVTMPKYHMAVKRYSLNTPGAKTWPVDAIPACVRSQGEVISFMRTEMERRYGGAVEDRVPIYQALLEEMLVEKGRPLVDFVNAAVLFYLHYWALPGSPYRPTFGYERWFFEERFDWKDPAILHNSLRKLEDMGYVRSAEVLDMVLAKNPATGLTEWREPVMSVQDEVDRAKTLKYELTPLAKEKFFARPRIISPRAGGPIHLRVMEHYIEKYRKKFCWVTADYGERHSKLPDLMVFKPLELRPEAEGRTKFDPYHWDYTGATAIEIETNPRKHQKQVLKNYEKCMERDFARIIFAVITEEHAEDVKRILAGKDPTSYTVEVAKELGLSSAALKEAIGAEERMPSEGVVEAEPATPATNVPAKIPPQPSEVEKQPSTVEQKGPPVAAGQDSISTGAEQTPETKAEAKPPELTDRVEEKEPPTEPAQTRTVANEERTGADAEEDPAYDEPSPTRGTGRNLTPYVVLCRISIHGLTGRNEIAERCGLSKAQTSRYLKELVLKGYLGVSKKKYYLTEGGKKLVESIGLS